MKLIKCIILMLLLFFTTSCYNYIEVNEIAIVEGIAIDYKDNNYQVITEIIDVKSDYESSYLIDASSKALNDAFDNIKKQSNKKLTMSHLEVVIISKEILLNHIDEIANYLIINNDITTNFYLVLSDIPKDIISNKNNNYPINSKSIVDNLEKYKNNKEIFDYIYTSIKNNKLIEIPYVSLNNTNIIIDKEDFIYEK